MFRVGTGYSCIPESAGIAAVDSQVDIDGEQVGHCKTR